MKIRNALRSYGVISTMLLCMIGFIPVSYTHLDVYKRQSLVLLFLYVQDVHDLFFDIIIRIFDIQLLCSFPQIRVGQVFRTAGNRLVQGILCLFVFFQFRFIRFFHLD